ncbi:MAG TPA: hypothetical protein VEC14_15465 [Reyranellaceae bacterium]|nr:hypothetical protein [Reyranellaceae bacterium]
MNASPRQPTAFWDHARLDRRLITEETAGLRRMALHHHQSAPRVRALQVERNRRIERWRAEPDGSMPIAAD